MVTIGTARVVSYSDRARTSVATVVLPLPDTVLWTATEIASGSPPVTVQNAIAVDQRCQTYIQGPAYSSGRPKYIRVSFKCDMVAGVPDPNIFNQFIAEKIVTFTNTATTGVAFTIIGDVVTGLANTVFNVEIPYPTPYGIKTMQFPISTLVSAAAFTEYEKEVGNEANQIIKSFRYAQRVPVGTDVPSFYSEIIFELWAGSRIMKWWIIVGNSQYVADPLTQYDRSEWTFSGTNKLQIVLSKQSADRGFVYGESTKLPVQYISGTGTSESIIIIDSASNRVFPDGAAHVIHGIVSYRTGASAGELDTITAETQAPLQVISENWGSYGTFGPLGALPARPNNSLIFSDLVGRQKAGQQFYTDLSKHVNLRDPYYAELLGGTPEIGSGGNNNQYGASKGWVFARSAWPDFRALELSCYQELCRPQHLREQDPNLLTRPQNKTGRSGKWSDLFFWDGRAFYGNRSYPTGPEPSVADPVGKREGPPQTLAKNKSSVILAAVQNWKQYDREHFAIDWLGAFCLLTGNRMARHIIDSYEQLLLSQLWPEYISNLGPGAQLITGSGVPRADGRMLMVAMWCYLITNNSLMATNMNRRMIEVYQHPVGGWVGQYSNFVIKPFSLQSAGSHGENIPTGVKPWENAITVYGLYAIYKQLGNTYALLMAQQIARTICIYGTRNNSESGGRRQDSYIQNWIPYLGQNGQPILETDKINFKLNFAGEDFGTWPSGVEANCLGMFMYAYELALQTGDATLQQYTFEWLRDNLSAEENHKGPYGWGAAYTNNTYDWSAIIDNPFKGRTPTGNTVVGPSAVDFNTKTDFAVTGVQKNAPMPPQNIVTLSVFSVSPTIGGISYAPPFIISTITTLEVSPIVVTTGTAVTFVSQTLVTVTAESQSPPTVQQQSITYLLAEAKYLTSLTVDSRGGSVVKTNQVFTVWQGDTHILEYTVLDQNGATMDLTGLLDIQWGLANDVGSNRLITKTLRTSGVLLLNQLISAQKGKFRVILDPTDTQFLNGKFYCEGTLIGPGAIVTLFTGFGLIQPSLMK